MDLNAPLGKTPPPKGGAAASGGPARPAWRARPVLLGLGVVLGAGVLAALGVVLWTADPHGGEPYVVAAIPPQQAKPPAPAAKPVVPLDPVTTGSLAPNVVNGAPAATAQPLRPAPQNSAGAPLIIDVAKVLAERERGSAGAPSGGEPAPAVVPPSVAPPSIAPGDAAPADAAPAAARPRVAIFVSGMGLSTAGTRTATELLPSAVSLAFVPYGETVPAAISAARDRGHEILLLMPMQNAAGAPLPGPHALQPGESAPSVAVDMAWLFGRIDGYDGVVNMLGAPVTSDRNVMGELMKAIRARGLFYLDDGTSKRSLGPALALAQGMPALRADVVLDATADPAVVHANLEALVAVAKRNGSAIGMASGLPDHLAAIAAFAAGLSARGIDLVPVSALAARGATKTVAK